METAGWDFSAFDGAGSPTIAPHWRPGVDPGFLQLSGARVYRISYLGCQRSVKLFSPVVLGITALGPYGFVLCPRRIILEVLPGFNATKSARGLIPFPAVAWYYFHQRRLKVAGDGEAFELSKIGSA